MPDESFLEDVFGPPPRPQPVPAGPVPAPAVPVAFARPRPVRSPSRRYGLLVTLLVGLTAVPSWIVLRAGLEGVDPDFGARLAGPVQPFVVPGDHLAPAPLRLPERPVRPAPQSDPGLAQAAAHDEEPDEPSGDSAGPVLEQQVPAAVPPARPVWRPVARPPSPGAVRPVPPPAPADPGPASPGEPSFPGPSFPGPSLPGPSLPGGGHFPGRPVPGGPVFPGGPWAPGGHARPHLPWHWHRHGHPGQGEPCAPGVGQDRGGRGRTVVAGGPRGPVPASRSAQRDLRGSASRDQARPAASRFHQVQRGRLKIRSGAAPDAAKREWPASGERSFRAAEATRRLPGVARVVPPRPARVAAAVATSPEARSAGHREVRSAGRREVRGADRREVRSPRGEVRSAEDRARSAQRLKPVKRGAGTDEDNRRHVRDARADHEKRQPFRKAKHHYAGKSKVAKSHAGKSQAGRS